MAPARGAEDGRRSLLGDPPKPLLHQSTGKVTGQAGPPESALEQVDKAHKVLERLAAQNISMRFDVDHRTGEVKVDIQDGTGRTLRTITLEAALDVAAGKVAPLDAEELHEDAAGHPADDPATHTASQDTEVH